MTALTLSNDQKMALTQLISWHKNNNKKHFVTLGGYAGTGKSTLIAVLRQALNELNPKLRVGFISFTGKATRVLRQKLDAQNALFKQDSVSTIHSLIYAPILNDNEDIVGWEKKEKISKDLLILDEASMVDKYIWQHILEYKIPIIAVGDHGQLPPIGDAFNLMSNPQIILHEIHRQALNNPIIGLSLQAREHGFIRAAKYSDVIKKYSFSDPDSYIEMEDLLESDTSDTLFLCGFNKTRRQLNQSIRLKIGIESALPIVGDRVICLRNNHKKKIFNGMLGTIMNIFNTNDSCISCEIKMDNEEGMYEGDIAIKQFTSETPLNFKNDRKATLGFDLFDFGYALTVHKAQGSQARKVILFEERFPKMTDDDWRRWLYTGITRAEEELVLFGA